MIVILLCPLSSLDRSSALYFQYLNPFVIESLLFREILENHNGNQGHQVNGSKKPKDASKPIVRQTVDEDLWSSKHKFSKNVITPYPVNDDFFSGRMSDGYKMKKFFISPHRLH